MKKKRGLGKRGGFFESPYFILAQALLVTGIGLLMLNYVITTAGNTLFEKQYYSRDVALLMNAVYASPGELIYTYSELPKEFRARITERGAWINETNTEGALSVGFPYVKDSNVNISGMDEWFNETKPILFFKQKDKLQIGTNLKADIKLTQCQKVLSQNITTQLGNVAIVPYFHKEYDEAVREEEMRITQKIADVFRDEQGVIVTQATDELYFEKLGNIDTSLQLVISSETDPRELPDNLVNIRYADNYENKSMKLACLLMEELSLLEGLGKGEITYDESGAFYYGLNVPLELEIGNLASEYEFDDNYIEISHAIAKAMKRYATE